MADLNLGLRLNFQGGSSATNGLQAVNSQLAITAQRADQADAAIGRLGAGISTLSIRSAAMTSHLGAMSSMMTTNAASMGTMNAQLAASSTTIAVLDTRVATLTAEMAASNAQIALMQTQLLRLNAQTTASVGASAAAGAGWLSFKNILMGMGVIVLAEQIFSVNKEFQSLRASLQSVTGSAENSQLAFSFIQDFAAQTPFDVAQVTESFIKLGNLGLKPSEEALRSYGNTARAMGKDMSQMIEAVADATTFEFERLKEFGIKSKQENESVIFTFNGVSTTVAKNAGAIEGYLIKLGNTKFGSAMALQAQTINGALSKLGDTWNQFMDHILNANKENAIAKWTVTAANAIKSLDLFLNGAISNADKLTEANKKIAAAQQSINAHNNNGAIGGLIDDLTGYDVNLRQNQLDSALKERDGIVAAIKTKKTAQDALINSMGKASATTATNTAATTAKSDAHKSAAKAVNEAERAEKQLQNAFLSTIESLKNETNELDLQLQTFSLTKGELSDLSDQYYAADLQAKGFTDSMIAQSLQLRANNDFTREKIALLKTEYDTMSDLIDKNIELSQQTAVVGGVRVVNPSADIDAAIAKLQGQGVATGGVKSLMEANQRLEERNQAVKYGAEITRKLNDETATFNENMGQAARALNAGALSQADFNQYLAQQQDLMFANSDLGKQEAEFWQSLERVTASGFDALLTQGKSATEAMTDLFKNMRDNILASFMDLGRKSLFDWVKNDFTMKDGGWLNVAVAGLSIGAKLLSSVLGADAPTRTASTAESYQSQEYGAGSMAIVDSIGRDTGFNFATKTAAIFNQNLNSFASSIQNNAKFIFSGIGDLGKELVNSQTFSWLGKAFGFVADGFKAVSGFADDAIGAASNFLGFASSANDAISAINSGVYMGSVDDLAPSATSKFLGNALAVIGAVYSIYDYVTSIGDIIKYGTVGQAVGATMSMVGGLVAAAGALNLIPFGQIIGIPMAIVGFLVSLFSSPKKPELTLDSIGSAKQFQGIRSGSYPESGGGIVSASSDLGLIRIASGYRGSIKEDALLNSVTPLLENMTAVDNAIADALTKVDAQFNSMSSTVGYIKANFNQHIRDGLDGVNLTSMVEQRYNEIANLAYESGSKAGLVFDTVYDLLLQKFKVTDDKTMAAMGIAQQVAAHLSDFAELPLALWYLIDERIKGVGADKTAKEFTDELAKSISGFAVLKTALESLGSVDAENTAIGILSQSTGDLGVVANNMAQYIAALQKTTDGAALSATAVVDSINAMNEANKSFTDDQKTAYYSTFGVFASLFADLKIPVVSADLANFSNEILGLAQTASEAANNTINYAIAENDLQAVSRESAIQTLLRKKAIDEETVANADLLLSIQKVNKDILDGAGFINSFAAAVNQSLGDLGVSANALFYAGKNVLAVFGDMDKASAFFDRTAKSFLTPEQQATVAARIADNNVASLLAANASLSSISVQSIQDMLLKGTGLNAFIDAFAQGNGEQAQAITTYIDALGAQLTANNALTNSFSNMKTSATDLQAYLDSLRFNQDLGTLSPQEQLRAAQHDFRSTLASANLGNADAAGKVKDALDQYLNAAVAMYSHTDRYQSIFDSATDSASAYVDKTLNSDATTPTTPITPLVTEPRIVQSTPAGPQTRSRHSDDNTNKIIAELKEQNQQLREQVKELKVQTSLMSEAFSELINTGKEQVSHIKDIKGSARRMELAK